MAKSLAFSQIFCFRHSRWESTNQDVSEMGKVRKYYSDWQHELFACSECGWTGTVSHNDLEAGDVAAIIECPKWVVGQCSVVGQFAN